MSRPRGRPEGRAQAAAASRDPLVPPTKKELLAGMRAQLGGHPHHQAHGRRGVEGSSPPARCAPEWPVARRLSFDVRVSGVVGRPWRPRDHVESGLGPRQPYAIAMDRLTTPLRSREAAALLGVSTRTLRRYISDGVVPTYRLPSGHVRIHPNVIEELTRPVGSQNKHLISNGVGGRGLPATTLSTTRTPSAVLRWAQTSHGPCSLIRRKRRWVWSTLSAPRAL